MSRSNIDVLIAFKTSMKRVDGLLRLHRKLHGVPGRPKQHIADILRGALVLAVGALDAMVLDSVVAAIPTAARLGRLGQTASKWVREEPERVLKAFAEENPLRALQKVGEEKLGAITFQRSAMIEGVLRDVLGSEGPWAIAAKRLSSANPVPGPTPDAVRKRLDAFVLRRHRIAHAGDLKPGTKATETITLEYVQEAAAVIKAVGRAVHSVIDQACSEKRRRTPVDRAPDL